MQWTPYLTNVALCWAFAIGFTGLICAFPATRRMFIE